MSRFSKKQDPKHVYFWGEGEWIQGPYVNPQKGRNNRKYLLVEVPIEAKPKSKKEKIKEPPKELFTYAPHGKFNTYKFKTLTGEVKEYKLYDHEHLDKSKCPVCGNHNVWGSDQYDTWVFCPCCNQKTYGMTKATYKKQIINEMNQIKNEIKTMVHELNNLEELLEVLNKKTK